MTYITNISFKKNQQTYDENQLLSQQDYSDTAKRIIYNYISKHNNVAHILNTDDVLADVITHIILADWIWNKDDKAKCLQKNYRYKWAIWTIHKNIDKHIKHEKKQILSLNYDINDTQELYSTIDNHQTNHTVTVQNMELLNNIKSLIASGLLTTKQRQYISLRFFDGLSIITIAHQFNISRQSVYKTINSGIQKIKKAMVCKN